MRGISPDGTLSPGTYVSITASGTNGSWSSVQVTQTSGSSSASPKYGIGILRFNTLSAVDIDIDDFVIYEGAEDNTAPNSPGTVMVNNATQTSLDVSWVAASGGTDGGGYVVVRYSTNPNADNDPNQNGIYAVGNTITNGTGSLTGTVRYIGTETSFTDNSGLTAGTSYWYKVYTVDKAFNSSDETMGTGSTLSSATPSISVGSITGFGNQVVNTTSSEKSYTVSGSDLTNNIVISPPANFEISLTSGSGFVANPSAITLTQTGGTVASTTIYVHFKPTAVTGYSGNITHTSTGASGQNVAVSGTGTAPDDPTAVTATASSNTAINVAFTKNGSNNVMIAWNAANTFGTPTGSYSAGNTISGGGTVLYVGGTSPFAHTSLTSNTEYYYKVWTVDPLNFYSAGVEVNASTLPDKPSNHATGFTADSPSPTYNAIDISWTDASGTTIPDGYVVKASAVSYNNITPPVDGTPETAGALTKIVGPVIQLANFTGLTASTVYYFKIWPYTNSGTSINYKIDGTPSQALVTTSGAADGPKVFFSEYLEGSSNNKALEIYNAGTSAIDLSKLTVKLYANGVANPPTNKWDGSTGTIGVNSSYVLYGSGSSATIIASANEISSTCNFNGDDALELIYDGQIVDVFGLVGTDPGTSWTIAGNATAAVDKTLLRKLTVTEGTTNWSASAGTNADNSQWVLVTTIDYSGNLGSFGTAWTGTSSSAWATGSNWDMAVPSGTVNAIIPDVSNDPEISTDAEVNNLLIKASGKLSISGSLAVNGSLLNNAGTTGLVVNSGASLRQNSSGVAATVKRDIPAWTSSSPADGWHFLSSPVTNQSIDLNNFKFADLAAYDFYAWQESSQTWLNQKLSENNITTFVPGTGYLVAYGPTTYGLKTFSGTLNDDNVVASGLTNNEGPYAGWNLVGNPYPCAIAWNDGNWSLGDFGLTAKILNSGGTYTDRTNNSPGTSDIIPALNGFMVLANANTSLTIPGAARIINPASWYKNKEADRPLLTLTASSAENTSWVETCIGLNQNASQGFDREFDGQFIPGMEGAPELYSMAGTETLSTNIIPQLENTKTVTLGFKKGISSGYLLTASGLDSFTPGISVFLEDLKTGKNQNLRQNQSYHFTSSEGDNSVRFLLHFGGIFSINEKENDCEVRIYTLNNTIYISSNTGIFLRGQTFIYSLLGQQIFHQPLSGSELTKIELNARPGCYLVKVITPEKTYSGKVMVR